MKHLTHLLSLGILACPALFAADSAEVKNSTPTEGADMLRFANHDTLHGKFLSFGAKDSLVWQSPESTEPITFGTKKIQRIILNKGLAHHSLDYQSSAHLVNGDIIPGTILTADQERVTMQTQHLGKITIPRNQITSLSPMPFGGKLLYYGPLNPDGWTVVNAEKQKKKKELEKKKKDDQKDPKEKEEPTEKKKGATWQHIANAWYAGTDKNNYLVRKNALPDKCRLSFKLAWRGTLYTNVILHADFDPPKFKGNEEQNLRTALSSTPGHAYVMSITTHSASLSSITYDEEGKAQTNRLSESRASLQLSGKDEADIEIRLDRPNKSILLYVDGSFKAKWSINDSYSGKGNSLGFVRSVNYSNSAFRISDIAISHWNGMKDSAESMSTPKRDVILLNNGVDRFSGTFKKISQGKVSFIGTYNNEMSIPTNEVRDIYFATNQQKSAAEIQKNDVYFFVYPYGRITGTPAATVDGKTKLLNNILGEVDLDTQYINIIDFSHKNSLLDFWDDNL